MWPLASARRLRLRSHVLPLFVRSSALLVFITVAAMYKLGQFQQCIAHNFQMKNKLKEKQRIATSSKLWVNLT